MRIKLIACEVIYREVCHCAARSRNVVDVEFLSQGLHDLESGRMCRLVQEAVDAADPELYEAVALGFGLCNNGLVGVTSGALPVVVPLAHDCLTFFFGTRERYQQYFFANPGTYYCTTGWMERDATNLVDFSKAPEQVMSKLHLDRSFEEYKAEFGAENAEFIMNLLGGWKNNYRQITYIDMGIGRFPKYELQCEQEANERGWKYDKVKGNLALLQALMDGDWCPDQFLILRDGARLAASHDDRVIKAVGSEDPV